jgi:hypothetical protein
MVDYSTMKSYLEKNNLHCVTFSPNTKKPIRAVIRHLPLDKLVEDISNVLEDLGFNIINMRQMAANQRAPHGQAYVETLSLFLVKSQRDIQAE